MRKVVKHNALSLFFLALFLVALVRQAIAGHADFNEDQLRHDNPTMSLGRYVVSSEFGTAVLENWQSEYLQFSLFILAHRLAAPARLAGVQGARQGGPESDEDQRVGAHAPRRSPAGRGWAGCGGRLYKNSLLIVMAAIFLGHLVRAVGHRRERVQPEQLDHHQAPVSWATI